MSIIRWIKRGAADPDENKTNKSSLFSSIIIHHLFTLIFYLLNNTALTIWWKWKECSYWDIYTFIPVQVFLCDDELINAARGRGVFFSERNESRMPMECFIWKWKWNEWESYAYGMFYLPFITHFQITYKNDVYWSTVERRT